MSKKVDFKDEYKNEECLTLINYHEYRKLIKDFKISKIRKSTPRKLKKEVKHD